MYGTSTDLLGTDSYSSEISNFISASRRSEKEKDLIHELIRKTKLNITKKHNKQKMDQKVSTICTSILVSGDGLATSNKEC